MVLDLELRPIARDFNLALRAWRARRRAQSAPAAMARALGPVDVALGVKFRLGTQAEAAWGSSTTVVRGRGRSLSLFHFTLPTAILTASGLSRGCSKRRVARMDSDHLCGDCDGTGWVLYRSDRRDGEFEEAYRLCPKGHAPRYCMGSRSTHLCPRPATVRCGPGYFCEEHIACFYLLAE